MAPRSRELIDKGFDADFSRERVEEFCTLFGAEDQVQALVDRIHEEDHTLDMKRGELYPEILRCIKGLKNAASRAYGIEPLQCHPNFGSNGSIDTILMAMKLREVNRGTPPGSGGVLVATPTYFRNYNSCGARQLEMIKVPFLRPDWRLDRERFFEILTARRPTLVILVTPNNPTGVALSEEDIRAVIETAPDGTAIMMDRTLVNLDPEVPTADLLREYAGRPLVILHSLSKYAGMSHLRVGFALYADPAMAEEVRPLLPLGLGVEGALKATRILLDRGPLRPSPAIVENIRGSKAILDEFCNRSRGFSCSDFVANYCILTLPGSLDSERVTRRLDERGVYVGGGHDLPEPLPDALRIHTGGRPSYMTRLVEALEAIAR